MTGKNPTRLVERLVKARHSLGLSQEGAADKAGLGASGRQILGEMERNKRAIKAAELLRLAKAYLRPLDYFLEEESAREPVVLWRQKSDAETRRLFLASCDAYARIERLTSEEPLQKFAPASVSRERLVACGGRPRYQAAKELAEKQRLGDYPGANFESVLLERFSVRVVYLPLNDRASAACTLDDFGGMVLVNSQEPSWRRCFSMAHELFHLLTWTTMDRSSKDAIETDDAPMEKLANSFAAEILMPENAFQRTMERRKGLSGRLHYSDLVGLAREFHVSGEAVLWRLVNLGYLKPENVEGIKDGREFAKWNRQRGMGEDAQAVVPSMRFIELGFRAMQAGRLSRAAFAAYLGRNLAELDRYLAGLGYYEEEDALL